MNLTILIIPIVILIMVIFAIAIFISKGKGKISIVLDKYQFVPGEEIKGKVILNLKKNVEAESLKVGLKAEKQNNEYYRDQNGGFSRSRDRVNFYSFELPIAGSGNYPLGIAEVPFSIKIPLEVFEKQELGGIMGKLIGNIRTLNGFSETISWYVTAKLEIPGIDLGNKTQINISAANN